MQEAREAALAQQTNSLVAPAPPPAPAVSPFGPETALGPETARKIVAFVHDEDSAAALRTGLAPVADDLDIRRGDLRHAIRFFEKEPAQRMAIVDIAAERESAGGAGRPGPGLPAVRAGARARRQHRDRVLPAAGQRSGRRGIPAQAADPRRRPALLLPRLLLPRWTTPAQE